MISCQQVCISLLKDCKTLKDVKQIHAYLCKTSLDNDPVTFGKLLLFCSVTLSDSLSYAHRLLLRFPNPDIFMYNALIRGQAESNFPQTSLITFMQMRKKSKEPPDSFSFIFLLKSAANARSLEAGIQVHSLVLTHGLNTHIFVGTTLISMYADCGASNFAYKAFDELFEPNIVTWNAVITASFRCGDLSGAEKLFDRTPFRTVTSCNIMLAGYTKAGELELAKKMFSEMPIKDSVSYSTMIVAFAHDGCFSEAFRFFGDLLVERIRPNEVSLTGVLSACAQAGAFEFGKTLHGYIEKQGFARIISVNNALLDTYSKCGNLGMARLVFEKMPEKRSIVSWTSMIAGLAMHGLGEEAIKHFHRMEESGTRPDGITFIAILYACSHAGLTEPGHGYFCKMTEVYGIEPAIEHYGCMVDLYGRAGQLDKASEFITQMPITPNAIIWRTLLGACSIHNNVKLAEQVKQKLSKLDPKNSGDHVLLSNIYAVAGKWKDVVTLRRSMNNYRIKKNPGWSMIEVDKVMYSFVASERENEITREAYEKLSEIMLKIRVEGGYVPELGSVLRDIEEEEKEDAMFRHSEKLAVAFGIGRLCKGSVIRIVKNLRVCRDCHTVMKLISRVYGLEIVVRDRSRFHSFKGGSCSCRDYW